MRGTPTFHQLIFLIIALSSLFSSGNALSSSPQPNLISKDTFVNAVAKLEAEMAKMNGSGTSGNDDTVLEQDPSKFSYGIGRLDVTLPLQYLGGLGLVEANIVLVNGVTQEVMDHGIFPKDTIVSISAGSYKEDTKGLTIEETGAIINAAVEHALENGLAELGFELNRLLKLAYAE